ncbi:MAG: hypothetical protein AAGI07_18115, partial [Bacteroidota bacterium]
QKAFALEEEKINSTTALIDEVRNVVVGYNPSTLIDIEKDLNELKQKKYTLENLDNESVMLAYDAACDQLLLHLNKLANDTENFERYRRANLLISDIIEANNQDFFVRKDYNNFVLEYNQLIETSEEQLEELLPEDTQIEKYPLFYGELES